MLSSENRPEKQKGSQQFNIRIQKLFFFAIIGLFEFGRILINVQIEKKH